MSNGAATPSWPANNTAGTKVLTVPYSKLIGNYSDQIIIHYVALCIL